MLNEKTLEKTANHACIESGTNGIWTYKKYADGTFDAYYNGPLSLQAGSAWAGGYVHGANSIAAPSFAISCDVKNVIKSNAPHDYAICVRAAATLPSIITTWLDRTAAAETVADFGNACITITGRWK